jgi:hypothetical protein
MTCSNPYALDDVWIAALGTLPDPRPLAALLRSDTPMTTGARYALAEMLHPGDPPLTNQRLVARHNPAFDRLIRQLGAAVSYQKAITSGTTARKAAEAAGKEAGVTARQAFRWAQERVPERLQERLRGADILASSKVSKEPGGSVVDNDLANGITIGALSMSS